MNAMTSRSPARHIGALSSDCGPVAATITNTVGHASANIAKCGEMLDEIELALFGPEPQGICADAPPSAGCLETYVGEVAASSASLSVRLERIASRIGRRN